MSHLAALDLSNHMMNGTIPEGIGQLTQLSRLDLWGNQLEGIISEIHLHNLTKLGDFSVSSKSKSLVFDVRPDWIPLFRLWSLTISDCQLGPSFPAWLRNQNEMSDLILLNDGISDTIPDWLWTSFSHIYWLDLSNNQLRGKLPLSINWNEVAGINLSSNRLEGSLPLCPNVTSLFLRNNKFSGPIPLNIGLEMPKLVSLDLSKNYINGSIPPSMSRMKILGSLNLANNYLTGKIPEQLKSLNLWLIDLSNNKLFGRIPSWMCTKVSSLSWLRLSSNYLSGKLDPSLQGCAGLFTLDLGENRLSGTIPKWIGENLTSMSYLLLGANMFTGNLPEQLCQLPHLQILDLSRNNISGPIPKCLNNLEAMKSVGTLTSISWSRINLPEVQYLNLNVKGRQYEYSDLFRLVKSIDLSSNNLSGEIPEEITKLSALVALNLSRNQLTGRIPESIGSLQRLETFDLSINHLWGPIPLSMNSMTSLSKLNLSYNNFSGSIPSTNQFQTFNDPTLFEGNSGLCGPPLPTNCSASNKDHDPEVKKDALEDDQDEDGKLWFYVSTSLGFIVGFWAVFGSLVIKRSWRHAYFQFLDTMKDRLLCSEMHGLFTKKVLI